MGIQSPLNKNYREKREQNDQEGKQFFLDLRDRNLQMKVTQHRWPIEKMKENPNKAHEMLNFKITGIKQKIKASRENNRGCLQKTVSQNCISLFKSNRE